MKVMAREGKNFVQIGTIRLLNKIAILDFPDDSDKEQFVEIYSGEDRYIPKNGEKYIEALINIFAFSSTIVLLTELEAIEKSIGLDLFFKGGPGSGNWEGPGVPRFAHVIAGQKFPPHIAALKIPPAWTNIRYNEDPNADLLVLGVDKKGGRQAIYSERFKQQQAAEKFMRIQELAIKFDEIKAENDKNLKELEEAKVLNLIIATGLRPGNDEESKADVKAYGATTLEGRHVIKGSDGIIYLDFVGKKGVKLHIPVEDNSIAKELVKRASKAGDNGKIFNTDAGKLLSYTHSLDGGGFKTKDFRTLLGTKTAEAEVAKIGRMPKDFKEYKKMVRTVAKTVAAKLGNTPIVALQSYVAPSVFAEWRMFVEAA